MTYNDFSFLSYGEAQCVKQMIDELIKENESLRSLQSEKTDK